MTGRERVKAAMRYQAVDKVPLQYLYTPVGFYEHGEKLNDIYEKHPGDFQPFSRQPIPKLSSEDFDSEGRYHSFIRDEWGTLWEYRIFGIAGIPYEYPLADAKAIDSYFPPPIPAQSEDERAQAKINMAAHKEQYYGLYNVGSLFERLRQLRPDNDVLMDMALGEPALDLLADRITEHVSELILRAIDCGADGISFGDDYGTERAMLISPELWRRFFKPRLQGLFAPAVSAGLDILFHSCGQITDILEDLRQLGVTAIWPQLPAYDMEDLAARCRSLNMAVAVHTDRAVTMTSGTPQQVRDLVKREFEVFRMMDGGAWFYVETDNGFPYENVEAILETIALWR